jgi:hypothetical protein
MPEKAQVIRVVSLEFRFMVIRPAGLHHHVHKQSAAHSQVVEIEEN